MRLDKMQAKVLNRLLDTYEKKGMQQDVTVSVRPRSIYRRYEDPFEDVIKIEMFEDRMAFLEKQGYVICTRDRFKHLKNIRLVTKNASKAAEAAQRALKVPDDGLSLLKKDNIDPGIDTSYYTSHPSVYLKERPYVLPLSEILRNRSDLLQTKDPINVRSFQIWQREKLISSGPGETVLKHCKVSKEDLNTYETHEPIPGISLHRDTPQNILIVENAATFGILMKMISERNFILFGKEFGTALYGGGGRIVDQAKAFDISVEPHVLHPNNKIFYFGDLDFKGINIFLGVRRELNHSIYPLREAYISMAKTMDWYLENTSCIPETMKEGQKRYSIDGFAEYFSTEEWALIKKHLDNNILIPQEILTEKMMQNANPV